MRLALLLAVTLLLGGSLFARGSHSHSSHSGSHHGSSHGHHGSSHTSHSKPSHHSSRTHHISTPTRTHSSARIKRTQPPCPATNRVETPCPGYVFDPATARWIPQP